MTCLILVFSCQASAFALGEEPITEKISSPPIAVGGVFYSKITTKPGYQTYYTHMGFEGGYIKVKYEKFYHYDEPVESEIYTAPLTVDRQALISTKPLCGEDPSKVTRLLITVVDDLGRIRVEPHKKQL